MKSGIVAEKPDGPQGSGIWRSRRNAGEERAGTVVGGLADEVVLRDDGRVAHDPLQAVLAVDRRGACQPEGGLCDLRPRVRRVRRAQAQQVALAGRQRIAREDRLPRVGRRLVEERASAPQFRFGLADFDPVVRAIAESRRAGQCLCATRHRGHQIERRACEAQVDHGMHLRLQRDRRIAIEGLVNRRRASAHERPRMIDRFLSRRRS